VKGLTKRSDVAHERLGDQGIGKGLELGVEDGLEPTPTLFSLRAELPLSGQAATPALLVGELVGDDATANEVCFRCVFRCGDRRIL
jgi:hypothetical protein